ncbi:MAG TPA: hypothetical protein VLF62_05460 [Candidatus Saccharimonadales bacterium]|nr:hypothetical protein [Candidatus Saccharimonadales bacterium]
MSDVSNARPDIFAPRSYAERATAHGALMPHAELAGHIAAAANVVMGHMPPDDLRHAHATEYLWMLADITECAEAVALPLPTKWDKILGRVGLREVSPHAGKTVYAAIRAQATAEHTTVHGGDATDAAGGAMAVTDMYTVYEPSDGVIAGSARAAVDSVMTGLILGETYPAGAAPQEPQQP